MKITKTPMRISFLGGGTDYPGHFRKHGGAVLGTAIDINGYHSVHNFYSELFDYNIRIAYKKVECVSNVKDIEHNLFRICLEQSGITSDIEINYTSEFPSLTGLGTSSTFVVGLLNVLHAHKNKLMTPQALAEEAIYIERELLKDTVGCQDQIFAAFGGFNYIEFNKNDSFTVNRLPLSSERIKELEDHLLLVYTGIRRKSTDVASTIVANIEKNKKVLLKMRDLTDKGVNVLLNKNSILDFGKLLHESWMHKSNLSDSVTNEPINKLYKKCLGNGAVGGKLLGAGGGGFLLLIVPPEYRQSIIDTMSSERVLSVKTNAPGSHIVHAQDSII